MRRYSQIWRGLRSVWFSYQGNPSGSEVRCCTNRDGVLSGMAVHHRLFFFGDYLPALQMGLSPYCNICSDRWHQTRPQKQIPAWVTARPFGSQALVLKLKGQWVLSCSPKCYLSPHLFCKESFIFTFHLGISPLIWAFQKRGKLNVSLKNYTA